MTVLSLFRAWVDMFSIRRERIDLAALEDHLLADIGLDREAVDRECARPFWDHHAPRRYGQTQTVRSPSKHLSDLRG